MTKASSQRVRVKRGFKRAHYDREVIDAILDATPVCHVGYVFEGSPYVTPTLFWREGDRIYWHGSAASRMIRTAAAAVDVCLTVTLIDGLVLARSAFHHTVNYRSVMLLGKAHKIIDPKETEQLLKNFVDGLFPGRWDTLRPAYTKELKATSVLTMTIDEVSAKLRTGPVIDEDEDYELPIWAGEIRMGQRVLGIDPDPRNLPGLTPPAHATDFTLDPAGLAADADFATRVK